MAKKIDIAGELNAATIEGIIADSKQIRYGEGSSVEKKLEELNTASASSQQDIDNLNANTGVDEYPAFSESTSYSAGDVVNYNGKLYKFTVDHAAGAWTGTDVEETDIVKAHIVQELGDSENAVISQKAVKEAMDNIKISIENSSIDLDISDESGNVLIQFSNGHIRTKNFNSEEIGSNKAEYVECERFSVEVQASPINRTNIENSVIINDIDISSFYSDNAVLYLPKSYDKDGNPTKLIIFCKHGGTSITENDDPIFSLNIFDYMLYLGYAILGVDGMPKDWVAEKKLDDTRVVGNYVAIDSVVKAYNYVLDKYNISANGCYIFGYSQGGHLAQNVIDLTNIPIAAAAELSPVCSIQYHQWDITSYKVIDGIEYNHPPRLNIARIFGFEEISNDLELTNLEYDSSKVNGFDPYVRNADNVFSDFVKSGNIWKLQDEYLLEEVTMKKRIKCPLKVWVANDDNILGVDVTKVFVKAIQNTGQFCEMKLYNSGGHSLYQNQTSISTFEGHTGQCNLYPLAYDIAIWYSRFGGNKIKK